MAGGQGSRLWPISVPECPKQFLDPFGLGRTMLQLTFDRFRNICEPDKFIVVTNRSYSDLVYKQLPEVPRENIFFEPFRRNTAPCIAFTTSIIKARCENATIIVTPADHIIANENRFINSIRTSVDFASAHDALVTIGVKPNKPETGFGYIQLGKQADANFPSVNKVKTFTEKPNTEMATLFYESGDFYWNAGVFVWSVKSIQMALTKFLPNVQSQFDNLGSEIDDAQIQNAYSECESISIDYGVMEKARNVYVQLTDANWTDIGTWDAVYDYAPKDENNNATIGDAKTLLYNTKGTIVSMPSGKVCVVDGLNDFMIIEKDNLLVICPQREDNMMVQYASDIKAEISTDNKK